jgi:glutamine---fructose-6-phosphate transaminase (isomerizing)
MLDELREIPARAQECFERTKNLVLPTGAPYLGMGSSYFGAVVLKYLGLPIQVETADQFHHYLARGRSVETGVLISQSGRSSETLWCAGQFKSYYAITNDPGSALATSSKVKQVAPMYAGTELASATKTYVNTLIVLYRGLRLNPGPAVESLRAHAPDFVAWGQETAQLMGRRIQEKQLKAVFILGNGPHVGTAHQAGLVLSECARLPVIAMTTGEFDHGPKEIAPDCFILAINPPGLVQERTTKLLAKMQQAGAGVQVWAADDLPEELSPITAIVAFDYLAYYLARHLGIQKTFVLGSKVTEV